MHLRCIHKKKAHSQKKNKTVRSGKKNIYIHIRVCVYTHMHTYIHTIHNTKGVVSVCIGHIQVKDHLINSQIIREKSMR